MNRRTFVGSLLGIAASLRNARWRPAAFRPGVQLYTVRAPLAQDFEGTLARIGAMGYAEVEFAGYHGRTPRQVRRALADAGLAAPAAHVGPEALEPEALERTVETAVEVGHGALFVPWIPEPMRTLDGYRRLAESFNRAAERGIRDGVRFGFHNQEYDFAAIGGVIPLDLLLRETEERVTHELDVYWAARAGVDPAAYLTRFAGRFHAVHLKDMTASREMTDLGRGTLDFAAILAAAAAAGVRHCFAEHDDPPAPLESLRADFAYLNGLEAFR